MMPPPDATRTLACPSCSKTFGRLEHLKRHTLIHTRGRLYLCRTCAKEFTRSYASRLAYSDALKRHEATHQSESSLLQTRARACHNCAAAKDKCSGELECSRCRRRNLQCTYPEGSRSDIATVDAGLILDPDFWDPNILSTSNWLDGVGTNEFELGFLGPPYQTNGLSPIISNTTPASSEPNVRENARLQFPESAWSASSGAVRSTTAGGADEVGSFYVDGEPARRPRTKRRRTSTAQVNFGESPRALSLQCDPMTEEDLSRQSWVSPSTHDQLRQKYESLCLRSGTPWRPFQQAEFPSKPVFDLIIDLYLQHFDQILPLFHNSDLTEPLSDILLILPIAAMGSHYLDWPGVISFSTSMLEFSRRLIQEAEEFAGPDLRGEYSIHLGRLLNSVGMAYSGDERLKSLAILRRYVLMETYTTACERYNECAEASADNPEQWQSWIRRESLVRMAYAAWLIDCMWTYHFQIRPSLSLRDGTLPVPCPENLWQASSSQEWNELKTAQPPSIPLTRAVQQLYIDKKLSRSQGQFARILLIHGLFHHCREIEGSLSNPLNAWEPTARREISADILPETPIWLPSTPTFSKWQNSTCDALDILHWQANATIGQASGLEHPEVLHLHTARVVLLVPHREILSYAKHLCTNIAAEDARVRAGVAMIQRWAMQHQFKARLAVIHSGVTFWHVRQYSTDAFHEAHAVALATLTMWAYGKFAPRRTPSSSRTRPVSVDQDLDNSDSGSDDSGSIILLDHPTDDELVQQFIRNGQRMRTHIEGVGDLLSPKGPRRVLLQGCKLLSSLKCWGIGSDWLQLLQQLATVDSRSLRERS